MGGPLPYWRCHLEELVSTQEVEIREALCCLLEANILNQEVLIQILHLFLKLTVGWVHTASYPSPF